MVFTTADFGVLTESGINQLKYIRLADAAKSGYRTGESAKTGYPTVIAVFLRLTRSIGLRGSADRGGPRIHDLRHTFAVRSLERCPRSAAAVSRHIVGLSTYLGHAHVTDTYWYLQASPVLMTHIADAGEALHRGEAQ